MELGCTECTGGKHHRIYIREEFSINGMYFDVNRGEFFDKQGSVEERTSLEVVAAMEKRYKSGPKREGQLWEPCSCGNEPVEMPLHLCSVCWPAN